MSSINWSTRHTQNLYRFLIGIGVMVLGHVIAYNVVHLPSQLEIVTLFSILIFYPILRYPKFGILLLFATMPFIPYLRRLYYLQYSRPSIDPLIMTGDIITGLIMLGLFFTFRELKESGQYKHAINRVIFLYFFYIVLRTFILNSLPMSEAITRFRFYGPAVLLFFTGLIFSRNFTFLNKIWLITIVIGLISALYGINQAVFGFSEAEQIWFNSISFTSLFIKGVARPFSVFQSPAAFADYLILAIIGIVVMQSKIAALKPVMLLLIPVYIYSILITSVRSSWIGAFIIFILWFLIFLFRDQKYRLISIVMVFLGFALIQFANLYLSDNLSENSMLMIFGSKLNPQYLELMVTDRMGGISDPFNEHSLMSRIALWRYLLLLCADPVMALLGRGVGALNADSLYFTYLAEFGFPGMIFMIVLFVFFIRKGITLIDKTGISEAELHVKGITIMNIVFAIINLTGTHIHSFPGDIYFWFWNGVLIGISTQKEKTENEGSCNT